MALVGQMAQRNATCQAGVCTTAGQTRLANSENDKHPFLIQRASANAMLRLLGPRAGGWGESMTDMPGKNFPYLGLCAKTKWGKD